MPDLYALVTGAGLETDHYQSDLYVRASGPAWELVRQWERDSGYRAGFCTQFRSAIDGSPWIECPFQFTPWWAERQSQWWRCNAPTEA